MKPKPILSAVGGIDVVSPETELRGLREGENVLLRDDGGFDRRPGRTLDLSLADATSLWRSSQRDVTLVKAGDKLYRVEGHVGSLTLSLLAGDLWSGPACYAERASAIYVSAGRIVRLDPDGGVRTPGVTSMLGLRPDVYDIAGGLPAGRYGVAVSLMCDMSEESGLSETVWIDLETAGGIRVLVPDGLGDIDNVASMRVYRTQPNGDVLYLAETLPVLSSIDLVGGDVGRAAHSELLDLLPSGNVLFFYNGRLYSALGGFLFYSEPYNFGLYQPRESFIAFETNITVGLPVDGGIYIGTDDGIHFLRGGSPDTFALEVVSPQPAIAGSGALVDPSLFALDKIGSKQLAAWLSPQGLQLGTADGQVLSPQSDRMSIDGVSSAAMTAFLHNGVRQLIAATPGLTLGADGATDSTP